MVKNKKIVVIGGGTGTFVVLSGLKRYFQNLTAIVSMADSGGSNRVIRDEFGLLPTSDIRQCFVALAAGNDENEKIMRQLFTYRFNKGSGSLAGMTFGNLFMAALSDILGSQSEAIKKTASVLRIIGKVVPVTLEKIELVAQYEDGSIIKGEHYIDEPPLIHDGKKKIIKLWVEPQAQANVEAIAEIKKAQLIILGPGDLYTSILANVVVKGISQAIRESAARLVYITNLMTKFGQTFNFSTSDHLKEVIAYVGRIPDLVIVNNRPIPPLIKKYYWQKDKAKPVKDDLKNNQKFKIMRADVLSDRIYRPTKGDKLKRSLIRHDPFKLAQIIYRLLV